jgi:phosphotransferase system HPr-like phosphotransfer protein
MKAALELVERLQAHAASIPNTANPVPITQKDRAEVVYLAAKHGENLSVVIADYTREQIEESLVQAAEKYEDYAEIMLGYCQPDTFTGSVKEIFWAVTALEAAVLNSEGLDNKNKKALYTRFAAMLSIYVGNIYNPELLNDDDTEVLPPLHRFGYYMALAQVCLESGDGKKYVTFLKKALRNDKRMKNVIAFLLEDFTP